MGSHIDRRSAAGVALSVLVVVVLLLPSGTIGSRPAVAWKHAPVVAGPLVQSSRTDRPCTAGPCPRLGHGPSPLAFPPMAWSNVTGVYPSSPPPLSGGTLAFDAADRYLVLFGGCDSRRCPAPAQTWEFTEGLGWTNITNLSAQPPARSDASLTFDEANATLVLFGGAGVGGQLLGDTWGFAAGHWTNLTPSPSPSPRRSAAMVYDRADAQVVLFGGCGSSCPLGDTWTFNGSRWTDISGVAGLNPPPARWGASSTYDGSDGYVLLVDGCGAVTCPLNDSWSFVGNKWTALTASLPPARFNGGLAFIAGPNVTYLFGGNASSHRDSDTWRFGGGKWANVTSVLGGPPSARAAMALVPTTDGWAFGAPRTWPFGVLFGGTPSSCQPCRGPAFADTWVLERLLTPFLSATPTIPEVGQSVAFSATSTGGTPPFNFTIQFGDGATAVGTTATHAYTTSGLIGARVTVIDGAGVKSTGTTLVSVVLGPIVSATVAPNPLDVGQVVNFTGSAVGGTPGYAYLWAFGDGNNSTNSTVTHRYPAPGTYRVSLTVTDSVGGIGTWSGAVVEHPSLAATFSAAPSPVDAGVAVLFTAAPSGGTSPYTVEWTFGDGATGSGLVAHHAYGARGNYSVNVVVTDAAGTRVNQTFALMVAPAPPGGPGPGFRWTETLIIIVGAAIVAAAALVILWYRRRTRKRPPAPIAAAGVGDPEWGEDDRSSRRRDAALGRGPRGYPRR